MSPMLLDGWSIRTGGAGISQRSWWPPRKNSMRWHLALDRPCSRSGRIGALRRPDAATRRSYHFGMNISAVLLAGGESRRMGRDKAALLFRGKSLWQIQLDTLRKLRPAQIFVSARADPLWRPEDIRLVADTAPSHGPLSGLAASLDQIKTTHLLALAIDMPWMSHKYLEFLCAQIVPGRGVVPKIGHRAEPLAAIYPREA